MLTQSPSVEAVTIPVGPAQLEGDLSLPAGARGVVLFAHGSGSSRHSSRNRYVAHALNQAGLGTLLMDLLTLEEEAEDQYTRRYRFDIPRLGERLVAAVDWLAKLPAAREMHVGTFGASTGAAAALIAAAERPERVCAVVSRGGRPDLAGEYLPRVKAPTLMLVGSLDHVVIGLNEEARARMTCPAELVIVPGATHLFEEPGTLEEVARRAADWFVLHLAPTQ